MDQSRQQSTDSNPAAATVTRDDAPGEVFQPLHEQIAEALRRSGVPGVALGIVHEGREHTAGFGVTNAHYPSPVRGETLFQIGSITKTVTATAILRLVEADALNLDVPIRTYLPDLRLADGSVAARVTRVTCSRTPPGSRATSRSPFRRDAATMRWRASWSACMRFRSRRRWANCGRTTTRDSISPAG